MATPLSSQAPHLRGSGQLHDSSFFLLKTLSSHKPRSFAPRAKASGRARGALPPPLHSSSSRRHSTSAQVSDRESLARRRAAFAVQSSKTPTTTVADPSSPRIETARDPSKPREEEASSTAGVAEEVEGEEGEGEEGGEEEEWDEEDDWEDDDEDGEWEEEDLEEEEEEEEGDSLTGSSDSGGIGSQEYKLEDMVEVGVITGVHGLKGDLRVKVLTDFPEQRFGKGGWKFLRFPGMARRVERVWCSRGRLGPGKGSPWLVRFRGYPTVEEASKLKACVILVEGSTRPELEEGEVYSADLIGLKVVLVESDVEVGVVEDVYSTGGAGELLRVRLVAILSPSEESTADGGVQANVGEDVRRVWVPFVKDIVPVMDVAAGVLKISPPPGLLELNAPTENSKKKQQRRRDGKGKGKKR